MKKISRLLTGGRRVLWCGTLLSLSLFLASAAPSWAGSSRKADLSQLVVVGASLSAGVQNGALLSRDDPQNEFGIGQENGYANLVAKQAGVELALPLISFPGVPNVITMVDLGPPLAIDFAPFISLGRLNPDVQAFNLAVPGADVREALNRRPNDICMFDPLTFSNTNCVLGLPGLNIGVSRSQVEWAEVLHPTTILVLLGTNDALGAIFNADPSQLTPLEDFETDYSEVMRRLAATGATLVVANIIDETLIPFLTSAEEAALLFEVPIEVLGSLGIGPGDFVTPDAFQEIFDILTGVMFPPLSDSVVLTAQEASTIRSRIDAFNAVIAQQVEENDAALVDLHALVDSINAKGLVVHGQRLTLDFMGGLVSLDGVHATNTGYAVIANEFIKVLNTKFHAGVPRISIRQIQKNDPLVFPEAGRPPSALGVISPEMVQSLRAMTTR